MKTNICIVGNMSPPIYAILHYFSEKPESFNVFYLDLKIRQRQLSSKVLGNFNWVDSDDNWQIALNQLADEFESSLLVTCVSYNIATMIREKAIPNVVLLYANQDHIEIGQSKEKQTALAEQSGFSILSTYYFLPKAQNMPVLPFPVVARPLSEKSGATFKVATVFDEKQLRVLAGSTDSILQPLIVGPKLLIHFARDAHKNIKLNAYNVTASYKGFTLALTKHNNIPQGLVRSCEVLLNKINYIGIGHIDLIGDGHQWYFLDLNLRFGGTTAKVNILGYNEAEYMWCSILETINSDFTEDKYEDVEVTNKIALIRAMIAVITNNWQITDYPQSTKLRLLCTLFKKFVSSKDELYSPPNTRFSIYKFLTAPLRLIKRV